MSDDGITIPAVPVPVEKCEAESKRSLRELIEDGKTSALLAALCFFGGVGALAIVYVLFNSLRAGGVAASLVSFGAYVPMFFPRWRRAGWHNSHGIDFDSGIELAPAGILVLAVFVGIFGLSLRALAGPGALQYWGFGLASLIVIGLALFAHIKHDSRWAPPPETDEE